MYHIMAIHGNSWHQKFSFHSEQRLQPRSPTSFPWEMPGPRHWSWSSAPVKIRSQQCQRETSRCWNFHSRAARAMHCLFGRNCLDIYFFTVDMYHMYIIQYHTIRINIYIYILILILIIYIYIFNMIQLYALF